MHGISCSHWDHRKPLVPLIQSSNVSTQKIHQNIRPNPHPTQEVEEHVETLFHPPAKQHSSGIKHKPQHTRAIHSPSITPMGKFPVSILQFCDAACTAPFTPTETFVICKGDVIMKGTLVAAWSLTWFPCKRHPPTHTNRML